MILGTYIQLSASIQEGKEISMQDIQRSVRVLRFDDARYVDLTRSCVF